MLKFEFFCSFQHLPRPLDFLFPEAQASKGQPSGLAPGLWGIRRDERENVI